MGLHAWCGVAAIYSHATDFLLMEQHTGEIPMLDLVKELLADRATDPRVMGSPEMELRWKAAAEITRLADKLGKIRDLVDEQAEDEGLWFDAQSAAEAYVQEELRKLHKVIEE